MKTTEQKAKTYDEVLEKAEALYKAAEPMSGCNVIIEALFPELKHSEDERIRKELIRAFKSLNTIKVWNGIERTDILAWLEKQGDANKEYWRGYRDGKQEILDKYAELEKQSEQKLADKVEPIEWSGKINSRNAKGVLKEMLDKKLKSKVKPKFHEGEWITNGDYTWKIVEVKPLDYILQSQDGNIVDDTISHVDEQFHSFTIEDAKEGDVLISKYVKPFIYNGNLDSFNIGSYCGITTEGMFNVSTEKCHWTGNVNIHPATKEQRDLLFQKMKEAGYEWNAEKKELNKIEQKTAWSEEDEDYFDAIIAKLEVTQDDALLTDNQMKFLKSLKDRVQPQQEWSEEDKEIIEALISLCDAAKDIIPQLSALKKWLKSLKDKVQPQNRWKPTEKHMRHLWLAAHGDTRANVNYLIDLYNDLKKLR